MYLCHFIKGSSRRGEKKQVEELTMFVRYIERAVKVEININSKCMPCVHQRPEVKTLNS